MSRAKEALELFTLVVEDNYGELPSRIFTTLLRRGRLPILAIAQSTRIPARHLRHGMAVLIQQNLVYYFFDTESKVTYYDANQHAAYLLLRSGKVIELARLRYGPEAEDIVRNLLFLGHSKVENLAHAYESQGNSGRANINTNNGLRSTPNSQAQDSAPNGLDNVLCRLLDDGLVESVGQRMFQSPTDTYNEVEKEILNRSFNGSAKGPKQKEELKSNIRDKLCELRSESKSWERKGGKRAANGVFPSGEEKRRKLVNTSSSTISESQSRHSESYKLDRNLTVRINHEKCTVLLRNQKLVSLAAREFGETTSQIYSVLLNLLEDKTPRCQLDPFIDDVEEATGEEAAVSTMELTQALGKSFNPARGIARALNDEGDTGLPGKSTTKRKRELENEELAVGGDANKDEDDDGTIHINGKRRRVVIDAAPNSGDDDIFAEPVLAAPPVKLLARSTKVTFQDNLPKPATREYHADQMTHVRDHLLLLAGHSCPFVRKCGSREWTVDFFPLVQCMKQTELDTIIVQRFGPVGMRISRILTQKGKLEEKQIQRYGLFKIVDVRTKLLEMQMAGFLDIQELAKDSRQSHSSIIFLWFFDTERVMTIIQEHIYKAMSRCLQRLNSEKREAAEVLELAERTDIRGYEELLPPHYLKDLQRFRKKEEKILTQISRLDELIAIFQDF